MSREEAERAKGEWQNIKNNLPSGIELVGEYIHAWVLNTMVFCYLKLKLKVQRYY